MSEAPVKFLLSERELPRQWINLLVDLPGDPRPPLNPQTMEPAGPPDLTLIFPMGLIEQEVSTEAEVPIPEAVLDAYRLWRPTPLYRARRLERELDTPAHIYYKYEGTSPSGSAQAQHGRRPGVSERRGGVKRLSTETGAGQWGSSLAFACSLFGLECEVFMVGSSYDQKPYRRSMMQTWGATVHRSPSTLTQSGSAQRQHPTGSLGIAISEAVEIAASRDDTNYALGSVLNHVLLHQTVIGQEAQAQMELAGRAARRRDRLRGRRLQLRRPRFPFMRDVCGRRRRASWRRAERLPHADAGQYRYDFGDTAGLTPLMPMYTLGHDFVPPPVHAGGLRYHGDSPVVSALVRAGVVEPAGPTARTRPSRPPSASPAARASSRRRSRPTRSGPCRGGRRGPRGRRARVILFGLCGHGHFDLSAYDAFLAGELEDPEFSEQEMADALAGLPQTPAIA